MVIASRLTGVLLAISVVLAPRSAPSAVACQQPGLWSVAGAFDLAANGVNTAGGNQPMTVPPSLLGAIGWVESNWRQLGTRNTPLVSPDFGYGIMQVTSGMAGAFGQAAGSIPAATQSRIASDYRYNIAYGLRILADKWASTPRIGTGDPTAIEDWYYAVWAYNGWGWVNNPNNPRFQRVGTPASDPATWPYQERVLYLVAHPPHDPQGNPLWHPIPVTLPARSTIARHPATYTPTHLHRQEVSALSAVYFPGRFSSSPAGSSVRRTVRLLNTGTQPWVVLGSNAVSLTYHLFGAAGNPLKPFSPVSPGVLAYGQHPVALPRDILPGQSVTLTESVRAPSSAGKYRIVWDLQEGSSVWFSQLGSLPRISPWHVGGSPSGPPLPPSVTPTATPQLAENLRYVADTGAPDGARVTSGSLFEKGWLVFNSGTTAWTSSWKLIRVGGHSMGTNRIVVPVTAPCTSANILSQLQAPAKAGTYRSTWRLRDPSGRLVGQKLTVVIQAGPGGSGPGGTPTATPTATPVRHPSATPTATPVG